MDKPNIRQLKKNRNIDGLNKALEHSDKKVRGAAAQALARLAGSEIVSKSSIKPLENALKDIDWYTRYCAVLALGWHAKFGVASKSSIEPLENALNDRDGAVRGEAAKSLRELEEAGVRAPLSATQIKQNTKSKPKKVKKILKKEKVMKEKKEVKGVEFVGMKYRDDDSFGTVRYTYEVYSAENKKQALEFIKTKSVKKKNYYIEVNVGDVNDPEVIVGLDIQGTYET